jgi:hypothetical protein
MVVAAGRVDGVGGSKSGKANFSFDKRKGRLGAAEKVSTRKIRASSYRNCPEKKKSQQVFKEVKEGTRQLLGIKHSRGSRHNRNKSGPCKRQYAQEAKFDGVSNGQALTRGRGPWFCAIISATLRISSAGRSRFAEHKGKWHSCPKWDRSNVRSAAIPRN